MFHDHSAQDAIRARNGARESHVPQAPFARSDSRLQHRDGAFYGKQPRFSRNPEDVIHTVDKADAVACSDLVRYTLSLPGVCCAIVGTGQINREKPESDQLVANLAAAVKDMPSEIDKRVMARRRITSRRRRRASRSPPG
jgi:hypothetical protein